MFYLSQSFEKATKSLLVAFKKKSQSESESTIEEYLSQDIGHDKKKVVKKVIDFSSKVTIMQNVKRLKDELSKSIKSYKHIESVKCFKSQVEHDFHHYEKMKATPNSESDFLHHKYYERNSYKFQIISDILRRYFNDIESNIRYPTEANNYSVDNPFNDQESKSSIKMLYQITDDFINTEADIIETMK